MRTLVAMTLTILVSYGATGLAFSADSMETKKQPTQPLWRSKEECENQTNKPCSFVRCEPEIRGRPYNEVCPQGGKGWNVITDSSLEMKWVSITIWKEENVRKWMTKEECEKSVQRKCKPVKCFFPESRSFYEECGTIEQVKK